MDMKSVIMRLRSVLFPTAERMNPLFKKLCILILALCMFAGSSFADETEIDRMLNSMTLREKIGQLFCVRPDALMVSSTHTSANENGLKIMDDGMRTQVEKYPVGGFIFFSQNIKNPQQVQTLMQDLSSITRIPPLFSVDEEGGSVARFANSSAYDIDNTGNMRKIGRTNDPDNARQAGEYIGSYLRELGFHLDFAPVADVNTNPNNTVIGNRAFGSDPQAAAQMVAAAVEGFHAAGVGCTLKHFPGHGDTHGDTHKGNVSADKTWEEMLACEIIPFRAGIEAGADAVMVAHIHTPNATTDQMPASLSRQMTTGYLRDELGFNGLIITDSLAMGAISDVYPESDEACMAAFYAGADMLLMPRNLTKAFDMMVWAVEENILPISRVEESVRRILLFKQKYGLI